MFRIFYLFLLLYAVNAYTWNMQGHQVIAQIAYDNLTPAAKKMCTRYLKSQSRKSPQKTFIAAASWMDQIKWRNNHEYDALHYIDIPFSTDGSKLPPIAARNAVWGINNAVDILTARNSSTADKHLALLILIHLTGDIHQPLHAVTKVSHHLPGGDLGGNLFPLGRNSVGINLHQYWDNGAGFFSGGSKSRIIKNKALLLERKWPCSLIDYAKNPKQWARASHQLAVNEAYQIKPKQVPGKQYQLSAQNLVQKQAATSGCKLSELINNIAKI